MLRLEQRFKLWIFSILALNVFIGFSSIALFERMLPTINHMLSYHDILIEDIEKMLFLLANLNAEADPELYKQFQAVLNETKTHLTKDTQLAIVERLEEVTRSSPPWRREDLQAVITALGNLSTTIRQELHVAYEETQFHGVTSGWIIVFIVTFGIIAGALFANKVSKQTIEPVSEMCRGLQEWRKGNRLRRFKTIEGTQDVKEAMQVLNDILDYRR